jgi:hypothetical protein
MDSQQNPDEEEVRRILFFEVKEALDELKDTGEGELLFSRTSWDNLFLLLETLINARPNIILFLGAGTSMTIKKTPKLGEPSFRPRNWDGLIKGLFSGLKKAQQVEFLKDQTLDHEGEIDEGDRLDLDNWFDKVKVFRDKPTLTWHLRQYFNEDKAGKPVERNRRLYELVSKHLESGDFDSKLLRQVVKLPFNDIITTNFDTAILKFLKEEEKYRATITIAKRIKFYRGYDVVAREIQEIFNPTTFLQSITEPPKPRLFYVHGKADKLGENFLVFDKFDFAKLIAGRDSILEYLIGQIISSTVVYFGFGLDDQTFNYIQERLRKIFGEKDTYIPRSYNFSTQTSVTEIEAFRKKHIDVISYKDHENLPKILSHINKILEYFRQAPENELTGTSIREHLDLTSAYLTAGREAYISEDYEESLKNYRLAMATLLFSKDTEEDNKKQFPGKYWQYVKTLINIRRHLVLNLSKLRWKDNSLYKIETNFLEGSRRGSENIYDIETNLLNGTIDRAIDLLKDCQDNFGGRFPNNEKLGIEARKASLGVLKARLKAHEGNIQESYNKYDLFEKAFKQDVRWTDQLRISEQDGFLYEYTETRDFLEKYGELLDALKNSSYKDFFETREAKYKADREDVIKSGGGEEKKQEELKKLENGFYKYEINEDTLLLGYSYIFAREQRRRHKSFLGDKHRRDEEIQYRDNYRKLLDELTNTANKKYFKQEFSTSLQTLADVLVIGLWEIGSRFVRYASDDLLPTLTINSDEFEEYLNNAIRLFSKNENKIPIEKGKGITVLPSPRWQTKMYRHKCRAYTLKWVKNKQIGTANDGDLLTAFTSFKKALELAEKANLKDEFLKSCLESARMNILVMIYTLKDNPIYALSQSAGYYNLSQAVEVMHELLGKTPDERNLDLETIRTECRKPENHHVWWLMIFILKIASYFSRIVDHQKKSSPKPEIFLKTFIEEFLSLTADKRKSLVGEEYRAYSSNVMEDRSVLDNLINRYEEDYDRIPGIMGGVPSPRPGGAENKNG